MTTSVLMLLAVLLLLAGYATLATLYVIAGLAITVAFGNGREHD